MTDAWMKHTAVELSSAPRQLINMRSGQESRSGYSDVSCRTAYGNVNYHSEEAQVSLLQMVPVKFLQRVTDLFHSSWHFDLS